VRKFSIIYVLTIVIKVVDNCQQPLRQLSEMFTTTVIHCHDSCHSIIKFYELHVFD